MVQVRRRGPNPQPWPKALRPLSWSRREIATTWAVATELADAARRMVRDAGADRDAKARARLLARTRHTLTFDVLGNLLPADVEARAAAELADTLRDIDESET